MLAGGSMMHFLFGKQGGQERGSAAILAVLVMTLLGLLGAAYVTLSSAEISTSAKFRDGVAAQYLAEAGAQWAIVKLKSNDATIIADTDSASGKTYTSSSLGSGLTAGIYQVTIKLVPGEETNHKKRQVISIGSVGSSNPAKRMVIFTVTLPTSSEPSVFGYPIFSGEAMIINSNATVTGSVRSNSWITLNSNCSISQAVITTQSSITEGANVYIGMRPPQTSQPTMKLPTFNRSDYSSGTAINDPWEGGSFNLAGKTYYRNGSLTIRRETTGTGIIYVTGNIIIDLKNKENLGDNLLIICEGDITVNSNTDMKNVVLYAYGNIILNSNVTLEGAAVAKKYLTLNSNSTVNYNQALIQSFPVLGSGTSTPFTISSWNNH